MGRVTPYGSRIVYRDIGAVDSAMEDKEKQPHIAPAIRIKEDIIKILA